MFGVLLDILMFIVNLIINIFLIVLEIVLLPFKLIFYLFARCCGRTGTGYWYRPWGYRWRPFWRRGTATL